MATKASATVTLFHNIDIVGTTYYYKLVSTMTTPNVPDDSVVDPTTSAGGSWSTSEPTYTEGSTSYLYYTIQTRFSDGTQSYSYASIVSGNRKACLSSSYEAAKSAYNKAVTAQNTADEALDKTSDVIVGTQTTDTRWWTGVASFTELTDGQQIYYWNPCSYASNKPSNDYITGCPVRTSSTKEWPTGTSIATSIETSSTNTIWLKLTLAGGNTTEWIPCYYGGTSRITSHYDKGKNVHMVYRENANIGGVLYTGWFADANYNSDTTNRLLYNNNTKASKQYLWSSRLAVSDSIGYFMLHGGVTFNKDKPILYIGSDIKPLLTNTNNYIAFPSCDLRYNGYWYLNSSGSWAGGTKFNLIDTDVFGTTNVIGYGTTLSGDGTGKTGVEGNVNDYYINTSSGLYYVCTTSGTSSTAKWDKKGNSTIPEGKRLYWGTHLTHTDGTAKATATNISSSGVGDRYINTSTGRLYECTLAGNSGTAQWTDRGIIMQPNKTVYLRCVMHDYSLTVDDIPFTTEVPTEEDGITYISIGTSYSVYQCGLFPEHPMFMFQNGSFKSLEQISYDTSITASDAYNTASDASSKINAFMNGQDTTVTKLTSELKSFTTNKVDGIKAEFSNLIELSDYGNDIQSIAKTRELIDSYIYANTNNVGEPFIELGVRPSQTIPNTYRLRIENNEIYMVYGGKETESLTKLTRWYTEDGRSELDVHSLITQQEMAIEPFRFIKNDDGSLSFRKVQ